MPTETLRPSGAGTAENIGVVFGDGVGTHHTTVNEAIADDDLTYVMANGAWQRDLYELENSVVGVGIINSVTIYHYSKNVGDVGDCVKPSMISPPPQLTDGIAVDPGVVYNLLSQTWNLNPADSEQWEWADIDAMEVGIVLNMVGRGVQGRCTQLYVVVDYTPGWQGKISGVTNPTKIMGVDKANIEKVKGVASA